jgi:hypothetical protein
MYYLPFIFYIMTALDSVVAFFTGADSHGIVDGQDKYLAIADFAGTGAGSDSTYGMRHCGVGDNYLNFEFGQEFHLVGPSP